MVQALDDARRRGPRSAGARVPPHNLQAEESLLGAMLLSKDAIAAALEVCRADDFYKPAHGHVFDAIETLYGQGEPADPVTVADELRRAGLLDAIGGPAVLTDLQAGTPAIGNAGHYARIVEEHALLRRLIGVANEIAEIGYAVPDDVEAAVDQAESMVFEVAERRVTDSMLDLRSLLDRSLDRLEALYERSDSITGTASGYRDLDERLSGLQPSNLLIVGARPGAGKTSFVLGMAAHAAVKAQQPVLFFSLEMSHDEVTQRLLSAEAGVEATKLRNGRLSDADWNKISHAMGRLAEAPLYIDDNPHLTVMEMRAKARRLKSRLGSLGLIVVDYLQLMSGRRQAENRQVEVSEISRGLKILARELETPVVACSQLSRNLEMRSDKRPMLADLRESGCLTADARVLRADTGAEVTIGELLLRGERDIPVWSFDRDLRMVPATMTGVVSTGVKEVFELRLASGRQVHASANHPFLTVEGWLRLDELQVGARVAVPRVVPDPAEVCAHDLVELDGLAAVLARPAEADRRPSVLRAFGLDGVPAGEWRLPAAVFSLPRPQLARFLGRLWASAGARGVAASAATFRAPSRRLVGDLQLALGRFGIVSRVTSAARGRGHALQLASRDDRVRFVEEILGQASGGRLGLPDRSVRLSAAPLGGREASPGVGRTTTLADRRMAALASSHVLWDEIVAIEALGRQPVYDATVAETHNFVANGITVENSLEQDADVVMFIYRDELYNAESQDRGVAEVIVAKHRSGPTGTERLAFLDRYTRFADMARV